MELSGDNYLSEECKFLNIYAFAEFHLNNGQSVELADIPPTAIVRSPSPHQLENFHTATQLLPPLAMIPPVVQNPVNQNHGVRLRRVHPLHKVVSRRNGNQSFVKARLKNKCKLTVCVGKKKSLSCEKAK